MDFVDIGKIGRVVAVKNAVSFQDGIHEYNFNMTKSTLLKRFNLSPVYDFKVEILKDPFAYLESIFGKKEAEELKESVFVPEEKRVSASVLLPLYSERREKHVPEKSGLNQWNAG